jgi:hypothetical protein
VGPSLKLPDELPVLQEQLSVDVRFPPLAQVAHPVPVQTRLVLPPDSALLDPTAKGTETQMGFQAPRKLFLPPVSTGFQRFRRDETEDGVRARFKSSCSKADSILSIAPEESPIAFASFRQFETDRPTSAAIGAASLSSNLK